MNNNKFNKNKNKNLKYYKKKLIIVLIKFYS